MNEVFRFIASKRNKIIRVFQLLIVLILAWSLVGGFLIIRRHPLAALIYQGGVFDGRIALLVYITTLLPGIARRLRYQSKIIQLLMMFRRYTGLLAWSLVFSHFWVVRGAGWILAGRFAFPQPVFIFFGIAAHVGLLTMALTSNDVMQKSLGVWWGRIHSLTYIILFSIFLHVALQKLSIWSILIGVTGVALVYSFAVSKHIIKQNT